MDNKDWGDGTSTFTLTVNTVSTDAAGEVCGSDDSRTMRIDKHARAPGASDHCCHLYVHPLLKTLLKVWRPKQRQDPEDDTPPPVITLDADAWSKACG